MSDGEPSQRGDQQSQADRTLLGVAPPRVESTAESPLRSPVFVRSGTSVADSDEPPPLPRMALPSRPPAALGSDEPAASVRPPARGVAWALSRLKQPTRFGSRELPLWQLLAAGVGSLAGLGLVLVGLSGRAEQPVAVPAPAPASATPVAAAVSAPAATPKPAASAPALLGQRAAETLSAAELLRLADARVEQEREAARALSQKLSDKPALAQDKATQAELLRLVADPDTAHEGLATMAQLPTPIGADLLYEVWTSTAVKNGTTELARTLVYSADVRPRASAGLAVALELRAAESCEAFKLALPKALKDGDRRSLIPLNKLKSKRGCGPKKNQDCFACLRDQGDELAATISAVKARHPPSYPAP